MCRAIASLVSAILLVATCAYVRADDADKAHRKELAALEGTWELTDLVIDGKERPLPAGVKVLMSLREGQRRCPLWPRTVNELLVSGRAEKDHVFMNRRGEPLTRFGIHAMVERYAARVAEKMHSVATKRVSPHIIR
jgi:hypothetical protein